MKVIFTVFTILFCISCNNKTNVKKVESLIFDSLNEPKVNVFIDTLESGTDSHKILKIKKLYNFNEYKVAVYKGKLCEPNFENNPFANDKEYAEFIKNGCLKNGINFCGHYTIIERSCGAECSSIFIVDRKNGKIFTNTKPNDGRYGFEYKKNSSLLIANSSLFVDDKFEKHIDYWCKPEFYKWQNKEFNILSNND